MDGRSDGGTGCGSCTLCCTLLGVAELDKPGDTPCAHCREGRGCAIYPSRPPGCRDFACAWLVGHEDGKRPDPALRPDRCHVVFHEPVGRGANLIAHVDPDHPRAWAEGPAMTHVARIAAAGTTVAIHAGGRHYVVERGGVYQATVSARLPEGGIALARGRRIGRIA